MKSFDTTIYDDNQVCRTHDEFYLNEDRKHNPKEYFKFIESFARSELQAGQPKVIDVGCATGDFAYFLKQSYPNIDLTGLDIHPDLIAKARVEVPNTEFIQGSLLETSDLGLYDIVFANGVHSIFDNLDWLDRLIALAKPQATLFIFGLFNPNEIDVLIKSRPASSTGKWETGWNVFSKKTIDDELSSLDCHGVFHDFNIGIDLPKREDDALRSWTETMQDGSRIIVNGLQLVNSLSLLKVTKSK